MHKPELEWETEVAKGELKKIFECHASHQFICLGKKKSTLKTRRQNSQSVKKPQQKSN